jgi:hypothetical protein
MSDFIDEISKIFDRDIQRTIKEIEQYKEEGDLWLLPSGINNSAGTLALHLAGNLQHFIGFILGKSSYERNRPAEFSARNISKNELVLELENTKSVVMVTLNNLSPDAPAKNYPEPFNGEIVTNYFILTHLASHLNYHLGQINYHRRLLTD